MNINNHISKMDITNSTTVQEVSSAFVNIFHALERAQAKGVFELKEAHMLFQNAVTMENYINVARDAAGLIKKEKEIEPPRVEEV